MSDVRETYRSDRIGFQTTELKIRIDRSGDENENSRRSKPKTHRNARRDLQLLQYRHTLSFPPHPKKTSDKGSPRMSNRDMGCVKQRGTSNLRPTKVKLSAPSACSIATQSLSLAVVAIFGFGDANARRLAGARASFRENIFPLKHFAASASGHNRL